MTNPRSDVAVRRRDQIVEAAVTIIAEQGLQNLSLSEIEKKAGMSRGQLTYYFPTKEDILLAVFDRLLLLMYERIGTPHSQPWEHAGGWECVRHLLEKLVGHPPVSPEFHCLQYTFLSQIGHREDFRRRLASLYEEWRGRLGEELAADREVRPALRRASPRAQASFVQAVLHGLTMQLAADPDAFDRTEMLHLCLDVLGGYFLNAGPRRAKKGPAARKSAPNGTRVTRAARRKARPKGAKA